MTPRAKTPHPGKTAAQRRVLDLIGSGIFTPPMSERTREGLRASGLIRKCGQKIVGVDRYGPILVDEWEMPPAVHMQWCQHCAEKCDDEP